MSPGTTLSLNSTGANVLGDITLAGNATIAGGATSPTSLTVGSVGGAGTGTLTINNNVGLKLATGSTFKVDLNGTAAGTQYDQAIVNGAVDLNGATLAVTLGSPPSSGNSYIIISNDGTDAVSGTFAGLAQGADFDRRHFQVHRQLHRRRRQRCRVDGPGGNFRFTQLDWRRQQQLECRGKLAGKSSSCHQ